MNDQNRTPQSNDAQKMQAGKNPGFKEVAIDLFKKSQRLPPLSLILKKANEKKDQTSALPPHGFEFADFYHL